MGFGTREDRNHGKENPSMYTCFTLKYMKIICKTLSLKLITFDAFGYLSIIVLSITM